MAVIRYEPHENQKRVHRSTAHYRIIVAGRQSGKTVCAAQEIALWAMTAPERWPDVEKPQFWWVTSNYQTKGKAYRDLESIIPAQYIVQKSEREAFFTLKNGSKITFRSADGRDSLVSERLHGLVCDEFTLYQEAVWEKHLSKMLLTTAGPVIFCGTPRGYNWAHKLFLNAERGVDGWDSFHWTSYDSPYVDLDELERQRKGTSDREWREEVLAEFITDGGAVFRNVESCVAPAGRPDAYTVIGIDLALTHDYCVLWAMNSLFEWVDYDRFNMTEWPVAMTRIVSMYRRNGAKKVVIDLTGTHIGGSAIETGLRQERVVVDGVNLESGLKRDIINNLILKFDAVALRIPGHQEVVEEHKSYRNLRTPFGRDRYTGPENGYDDTVIANALACWGLRHLNGRVPTTKQPETELQRHLREERQERDGEGSGWSY